VVQWAKPKCQVSLADPQLEGKEEERRMIYCLNWLRAFSVNKNYVIEFAFAVVYVRSCRKLIKAPESVTSAFPLFTLQKLFTANRDTAT